MQSDIESGLPIRSVADGADERVHVKLVDFADPSGVDKQVQVSEKKVHVRAFAKDSDGADKELLLSQEGHVQSNGDYDASLNKRPSSQGFIAHDRAATAAVPTEASQNKRPTAVAYDDGASTVIALDVAIRDENGVPYSKSNPMPVAVEESEGTEVHNVFESASAISKNGTDEHVYTAIAEFELDQWGISASGYMKGELLLETGVATGTFVSKGIMFNSTAMPNADLSIKRAIKVAAGVRIKIKRTQLDNQSQTMYSFMNGLEN
jgi:hypothetical protein